MHQSEVKNLTRRGIKMKLSGLYTVPRNLGLGVLFTSAKMSTVVLSDMSMQTRKFYAASTLFYTIIVWVCVCVGDVTPPPY